MEQNLDRQRYCDYCDEYADEFHNHDDDGRMCVCGHYEADHHRSWFAVTKYTPNGGQLIEECEYYGWNESGGMMRNEEGRWQEHCYKFKAKEG